MVATGERASPYEGECCFQVLDAGSCAFGESAFGELFEAVPVAADFGGEAVAAGAVAGQVGVLVRVGAQAGAQFGHAGLQGVLRPGSGWVHGFAQGVCAAAGAEVDECGECGELVAVAGCLDAGDGDRSQDADLRCVQVDGFVSAAGGGGSFGSGSVASRSVCVVGTTRNAAGVAAA